jgi:hypothetical protein
MAVGRLNIKNGDFDIDAGLANNLEELALAVGPARRERLRPWYGCGGPDDQRP